MQSLTDFFKLSLGALFLRNEVYAEMRDSPSPFVKGLILIVLVSVVTAAVGVVGTTLEWAAAPPLTRIRETVWEGMMEMPWAQQIPLEERPRIMAIIQRQYDLGWRVFPALFGAPNPISALINVVVKPILLLIRWLIYGILAHLFARLLGGRGRLAQTYGCTALAVSPQLLNLVHLVPNASVSGLALWGLICNYLALKNGHDLSPGRAFWATILPFVTLLLIAILLAILGGAVMGNLIRGGW